MSRTDMAHMIIRGRVIDDSLVEFGGRGGSLRFMAPDPHAKVTSAVADARPEPFRAACRPAAWSQISQNASPPSPQPDGWTTASTAFVAIAASTAWPPARRTANPAAVVRLIGAIPTLSSSTQTNLTTPQMIALYRRFRSVDPKNIRHVSLKPLTEIFEVRRITEPGEAVRPRAPDYRELQAVEKTIFSSERPITTDDQIRFAAAPAPPARQAASATD